MTREVRRRPDAGYRRRSAQPVYRDGTVGASAPFRLGDPGLVLAVNARLVLAAYAGPCAGCGRAMLAGQRIADLAGGGTAHTACVGGGR